MLGARYEASPVIVSDGSRAPDEDAIRYVPSACPGSLAPHLWLEDGASLYDYFGPGFTLLVTHGAATDAGALIDAAANMGVPLKILSPDDPRLEALYESRFALIRPDQHVAWRGSSLPRDAGALLAQVTGSA